MSNELPQLVSRADLAAALGLSKVSIFRYEHDDPQFPRPVVFGRKKMYALGEITEWLETRRGIAVSEPARADEARANGQASNQAKRTTPTHAA